VHNDDQVASDVLLIQKISSGDREAFETFHNKYVNLVFSTVLKILNNTADTEDVTQNVMFMVWEKSPMFDATRGNPLTWVSTMARNKAIDKMRSIQRRNRLHEEAEAEIAIDEFLNVARPGDSIEASEQGHIIRSAVLKLNPEQRQVIEMSYFMGLTQLQIAERTNTPLGTIKARIRRGILQLQKIVKNKF